MTYLIISAVRDEAQNIEKVMQSVLSQSVRPSQWVIVNDGSGDGTEVIASRYASRHPWIVLINRKDRGFAQVGRGVVESFNEGLKNASFRDWEFIAKLDCDLELKADYFESLLQKFRDDVKLGVAGGATFIEEGGKWIEEKVPDFHPMAAARMYRRRCFEDIGGLLETLGWDTIDLLRAQMKGWTTRRFKELRILHARKMASRGGLWEGKLRTGKNFYITGYHPVFLIARCFYRLKERPFLVESAGVLCGYFCSMWNKEQLVVSRDEKKFLQRQQLGRLFGSRKHRP